MTSMTRPFSNESVISPARNHDIETAQSNFRSSPGGPQGSVLEPLADTKYKHSVMDEDPKNHDSLIQSGKEALK
jgi:hypothetical protein